MTKRERVWAALACGAGWWVTARRRAPGVRVALAWLALCAGLMLAAAAVETFLAGAA